MKHLEAFDESRVGVLLSWGMLYGKPVSESDLVEAVGRLPLEQVLPYLVRLLQFGDATEPPAYAELDGRISETFPCETARWIAGELSEGPHWIFFSQWQLLFAIKLLCTLGSRDGGQVQVTTDQFLKLLLMTNEFYPRGESGPLTVEGVVSGLKRTTLRGYSLVTGESRYYLIGRYAEIFGRLAAPDNQSDFRSWVDIDAVLADKLGIQLDTFKAALFALCGLNVGTSLLGDSRGAPELNFVNPVTFLADTELPQEGLNRTLELVSTSPDEIREDHYSNHGESIGNPLDLGILLRKPVISLADGRLAGISGQLLIQRYTCGLYWEINDALPNGKGKNPNRELFQTFFGELHERYGLDTLRRVRDGQLEEKRKIRLLSEQTYATEGGPNPDALVIETIA